MKRSLENLNIALVHEWITNVAGAEKVLLALSELFPKAPIFTAVFDEKKAKPFVGKDIRTSFLQKIPFMKSKRELLVPFVPFAFEQFDLSKYDFVISSTTVGAKGVITKPETIHLSYCHTPTRYIWEPQIDPRATKGSFGWLRKKIIHKLRIWDRLAADRPDYYVANSKYVRNRIRKFYRRDADVIYPPVDIDLFRPVDRDEVGDYFLFVSRLVDYKHADIAVKAFNELNLPLKVVGYGPESGNLKSISKENIEFLGGKFGAELRDLYAHAKAFIFVAEEDFGIVPVEAMACGRPVIAFGQGGAAESVIPGVTGLTFPEQSVESLIEAVKSFDMGDYDSDKIRKHAETFSKANFQKQMLAKIEELI
ncbi:MAG: glycosyltransferase [Candidatus Berkelbacteria bacterium]|nr:glycosyltransferase [Candidatus Berkelbacteria bacterium]